MKALDVRRIQSRFMKLPPLVRDVLRLISAVSFTIAMTAVYVNVVGLGHPYLVGLFPVMICAVFLRTGPGLVSLGLTAIFINLYEVGPQGEATLALTTGIFLLEGMIVIWVAHARTKARQKLAQTLEQRSRELAELKLAHDKLARAQENQDHTVEQIKRSNEVMLDTLERILGKPNR